MLILGTFEGSYFCMGVKQVYFLKKHNCPNFPKCGTDQEKTLCYTCAKYGADLKPGFKVNLLMFGLVPFLELACQMLVCSAAQ